MKLRVAYVPVLFEMRKVIGRTYTTVNGWKNFFVSDSRTVYDLMCGSPPTQSRYEILGTGGEERARLFEGEVKIEVVGACAIGMAIADCR